MVIQMWCYLGKVCTVISVTSCVSDRPTRAHGHSGFHLVSDTCDRDPSGFTNWRSDWVLYSHRASGLACAQMIFTLGTQCAQEGDCDGTELGCCCRLSGAHCVYLPSAFWSIGQLPCTRLL